MFAPDDALSTECVEEETSFLADLETIAKRGQITTKAEVKVAFEKRVRQQVAKSTIYRLLNRHQWRCS